MKLVLAGLLLGMSFSAFSRQYIQCADPNSWDSAVINLDGEHSTLFLTNGVHLPDEQRVEVLKRLYFINDNGVYALFHTNDGPVREYVKIPSAIVNTYSSNFNAVIGLENVENDFRREQTLVCFSALYEK